MLIYVSTFSCILILLWWFVIYWPLCAGCFKVEHIKLLWKLTVSGKVFSWEGTILGWILFSSPVSLQMLPTERFLMSIASLGKVFKWFLQRMARKKSDTVEKERHKIVLLHRSAQPCECKMGSRKGVGGSQTGCELSVTLGWKRWV